MLDTELSRTTSITFSKAVNLPFERATVAGQKGQIIIKGNDGEEFTTKALNASYVTKNSAPREAYLKLLSKSDLSTITSTETTSYSSAK